MKDATSYIVNQNGIVYNQNGDLIHRFIGLKPACRFVSNYITNVRGKTFTEEWLLMGRSKIFTVA